MSYTSEALQEWAWIAGQDRPDSQWLLSNYDSWERNPHYDGPDQPHPEEDDYEAYDDYMDGDHDSALASAGWGTDEDYGCFCEDY